MIKYQITIYWSDEDQVFVALEDRGVLDKLREGASLTCRVGNAYLINY